MLGRAGDAERAQRGERRGVDEVRADVDRGNHADGVGPGNLLEQTGHQRQEGRHDDAGGARVGRDDARHEAQPEVHRRGAREGGDGLRHGSKAARLLHDLDEDGHAADHHDDEPGHRLDGGLAVGHVEEHHEPGEDEPDGTHVGGHQEHPLREVRLHAGKGGDDDQHDQDDDAGHGEPLLLREGLGLRGDRVDVDRLALVLHHPLPAAEDEEAGDDGHALCDDGVEVDLPVDGVDGVLREEVGDLGRHLRHEAVGDDPRGGEGREGSRVGGPDDDEGHAEGRHPHLARDGHGDGGEQGHAGDVARADRGDEDGQQVDDQGQQHHVAAAETDAVAGDLPQGPVDLGHGEHEGHADQYHEETEREARHDLRCRHVHEDRPDDDREGDAQVADVKLLVHAADDDDDGQGQDGHPGRQGYAEKFHVDLPPY